jgi:hypothetical protein
VLLNQKRVPDDESKVYSEILKLLGISERSEKLAGNREILGTKQKYGITLETSLKQTQIERTFQNPTELRHKRLNLGTNVKTEAYACQLRNKHEN